MKHGRLGFTESSLLFCYYLRNNLKIDTPEFKQYEHSFLYWLITTSGFYDISFNLNYIGTDNYVKLMNEFDTMSKKSTFTRFLIHETEFSKYLPDFYSNYNVVDYSFDSVLSEFNEFVKNKNVLIINPMSELMKHQYESGNLSKINNFQMKSIQCYTNNYTFLNNSTNTDSSMKNRNSFDYVDSIMEEIDKIECDCVVISCGAISSLIANKISKDYLIIGSNLLVFFGIKHERMKIHPHETNEYWINVPDQYKPTGYKMIEGGCYW